MMRQQLIYNIQQIHPSSQNIMKMSLLMLLCLSHRKWTLRAFRRRGKRRYSYKHYHCPLNMCVQIGIKQLNRSTNVKPRCTATGWTPWECRPAWTTSTQVQILFWQLNHSHFLSQFLPRNLISISHNLWVDHFFFWRRYLIDVILQRFCWVRIHIWFSCMFIFRPQQWTDHIPGKKILFILFSSRKIPLQIFIVDFVLFPLSSFLLPPPSWWTSSSLA